ncbi:MAG: hypothetical protein AB7F75_07025 [Planctomycetota bacterium]
MSAIVIASLLYFQNKAPSTIDGSWDESSRDKLLKYLSDNQSIELDDIISYIGKKPDRSFLRDAKPDLETMGGDTSLADFFSVPYDGTWEEFQFDLRKAHTFDKKVRTDKLRVLVNIKSKEVRWYLSVFSKW